MASKYRIGQRVRVTQARGQHFPAGASLGRYSGQVGVVDDCYSLAKGKDVFYVYNVRVGDGKQEVVLHEDELETLVE